MTERINEALSKIEEELESAINIVIYSAEQIKKEIGSENDIIGLIKNINSKTCVILDLYGVTSTLRKIENGNEEEPEEEPFQ